MDEEKDEVRTDPLKCWEWAFVLSVVALILLLYNL